MQPPRLPQVRHGGTRHPEQRIQIGLEDPVEALVVDRLEAVTARHLEARVVDQDVETAEPLHRLDDGTVAGLPVPQVGLDRDAPSAGGVDQLDRRLRVVLLLGHEGEGDIGALAGERQRHGPADARVAAGDEGPLALETSVTLVGVLAVVRPRLHLFRETGRLLLLGGKGLIIHERDLVPFGGERRLVVGLVHRIRCLSRLVGGCRGFLGGVGHRSSLKLDRRARSTDHVVAATARPAPHSHRRSDAATGVLLLCGCGPWPSAQR